MATKKVVFKPMKPIKGEHVTITQRGPVVEYNFDEDAIGKPVAEEWRNEVSKGIQQINEKGRDQTHRYANVTGYFAQGIQLVLKGGVWLTTPPPGRLDVGWSQDAVARFMARLQELVPAIGRPAATFKKPGMRKALARSLRILRKVGRMRKG